MGLYQFTGTSEEVFPTIIVDGVALTARPGDVIDLDVDVEHPRLARLAAHADAELRPEVDEAGDEHMVRPPALQATHAFTGVEPADVEPADVEPADVEPAGDEPAGDEPAPTTISNRRTRRPHA